MLAGVVRAISLSVAGVVFFAAGCGVHCVHPLSDPAEAFADAKLLGTWRLRLPEDGSGTEVLFQIGTSDNDMSANGSGRLRCHVIHSGGSGQTPFAHSGSLFTTLIGERKIANLCWQSNSGEGRYTLAKYVVTDDQLQLFTLRTNPVCDALEAKELHGTVTSSWLTKSVVLTDNEDALFKFVATADDEKLFGTTTTLVFDRIKP